MKIEKNANGIVKGFTLDNDVFVSAKCITEYCKYLKSLERKANIFYYDDIVGTISRELDTETMEIVYVIDLDKEAIDALGITDACFMPGTNLRERDYRTVYHRLPYFVTNRTVDGRMGNIDFYMKRYGMTTYDRFDMFLRIEGRHEDEFHVEEIPIE